MNRSRSLLVILLFLPLSGCGLFGDDDGLAGRRAVYEGTYSQGIEDSVFEPCDAPDESWRIDADDTAFYDSVRVELGRSGNPMHIRVRGIPSEKGSYEGIFATYDRRFALIETLSVRELRGTDCGVTAAHRSGTHPASGRAAIVVGPTGNRSSALAGRMHRAASFDARLRRSNRNMF